MERRQLNEIYAKLDKKAQDIAKLLGCDYGYYNGHYHKNETGNYEKDYFPIPVISVKGLCDVEIDLDGISVTAKLTKDRAISYDFEKIKSFNFEVYGVENYLEDFYVLGDTIASMIEKLSNCKEENVFFSFYFTNDTPVDTICKLVKLIEEEGFFY